MTFSSALGESFFSAGFHAFVVLLGASYIDFLASHGVLYLLACLVITGRASA